MKLDYGTSPELDSPVNDSGVLQQHGTLLSSVNREPLTPLSAESPIESDVGRGHQYHHNHQHAANARTALGGGQWSCFFHGCVMSKSDVCSFLIWCVDMNGSRMPRCPGLVLSWSRLWHRLNYGWSFRSWTFIPLTHACEDDSLARCPLINVYFFPTFRFRIAWLTFFGPNAVRFDEHLADLYHYPSPPVRCCHLPSFKARRTGCCEFNWICSLTELLVFASVSFFYHSLLAVVLMFFFSLWVMRGSQSYITKNDLFIPFYSFPPVDSFVESSALVMIWTGKKWPHCTCYLHVAGFLRHQPLLYHIHLPADSTVWTLSFFASCKSHTYLQLHIHAAMSFPLLFVFRCLGLS